MKKQGSSKKAAASKREVESPARRLKALAAGLLFQSESDYPLEPFEEKGARTAREVIDAKAGGADAEVKELSFESFFANATKEQEWHDDEARATVKKFQALVKFMKESLSDIKVYRVGGVEADVYVVGKTESGSFAGLKTKVVET